VIYVLYCIERIGHRVGNTIAYFTKSDPFTANEVREKHSTISTSLKYILNIANSFEGKTVLEIYGLWSTI
jgi:RecA/RadA recombinase